MWTVPALTPGEMIFISNSSVPSLFGSFKRSGSCMEPICYSVITFKISYFFHTASMFVSKSCRRERIVSKIFGC